MAGATLDPDLRQPLVLRYRFDASECVTLLVAVGPGWEPSAVTAEVDPKPSFWWLVGRPFRAVGRGVARAWGFLDFVSLIANIARGVAWGFRGLGRVISDWF